MIRRLALLALPLIVAAAACGSDDTASSETTSPPGDAAVETTVAEATATTTEATAPATTVASATGSTAVAAATCDDVAASFVSRGSANPDLADPEVAATCDGSSIVISANGVPDYTYIETSPGQPAAQDLTFTIPAEPTLADDTTDIPLLGTAAVAVNGVPIYGPTEGTGGDVLSLVGGLSDCGSHNGPTGFHMHLFGTSESTDCLYTPEEAAAEPQLLGYALDGYPIYTGNDVYTSSWELTDDSLFATDTWAAHTYVEGSGDLDQCNGRTDDDGYYAYFTTDTFPYILGCYSGEVDVSAAGGGGNGGGQRGAARP